MKDETRKKLDAIDALVTRMRTTSVEDLSEEDLCAMMEVTAHVMSGSEHPFSEAFIKQICATYGMHEPLIVAAQQDHRELKTFIAMLSAAIETSDEPNPDMIAMFTRLIAHMNNIMAMLNRLHEAARQANTVMGEYSV